MAQTTRFQLWLPLAAVALALFTFSHSSEAGEGGRTQAQIELGRRLFMDPTVSRAGKFSCASCHDPEHGFSDPRRFSVDENGKTARHSQTVVDLVDGTGFHWDGEFDHIHELLTARLAPVSAVMTQTRDLLKRHFEVARIRGETPSRREFDKRMATLTPPYYGPDVPATSPSTPLPQPLLRRLAHDGRYEEGFRAAFGSPAPTTANVVGAMKAYMLSLKTHENRYDKYLAGSPDALTASERRGLHLFENRAGCAQCHPSRPATKGGRATFTDQTFRNTGVAFRAVKLDFEQPFEIDSGLGKQTFAGVDIGRFKVPSLRDIAERAPYMHDGSFKTLESVVDYYEHGGTTNGRIDPKLKTFRLTERERNDLVAFLKALSSPQRAGLGKPRGDRVNNMKVRLVAPSGRPIGALAVKVTPFGDRLEGARRSAKPFTAMTDAHGYLQFKMPLWTHVKLSANGYEIGYDRPLPDTLRRPMRLLTVPRNKVYVEVFAGSSGKALPAVLIGKVRPGAQGSTAITLRRMRRIKSGGTLYVANRPRGLKRVLASFNAGGNSAAMREIDTTGGIAEPLDFRQG
ncbi:MAG: cytochrome-c peroxidase [Planctomycetota bacterium]|jgi:cytochrome c peroxidase